jgi:hypothetical protein
MKSQNGIVVNEFESIEACFFSKKFDTFELQAHDFLRQYWTSTISSLVTERMQQQEAAPEVRDNQPLSSKRQKVGDGASCDL